MSEIDSSIELSSSAPAQGSEQSALSQVIMELSPPQQAALGALAGGQTFSSAAESAGVTRMTLWRWLSRDPAFAEAHQWKLELRESAEAQLLRVGEHAVAAVARAAEGGDAKISMSILREMGIFRSAGRCADPRDQPIL